MTSKIKEIAKGGWHPEKPGQSFRQQVTGMFKGDDPSQHATNHVSRPLSSLPDPSSFGPPPKHRGAYGGTSPARTGSPAATSATSASPGSQSPQTSSPPYYAPPSASSASGSHSRYAPRPLQPEEPPAGPPRPYRIDTTGLSTAHLPPPPVRRDSPSAAVSPRPLPSPSSPSSAAAPNPPHYSPSVAAHHKPAPPSLPPRLPPRSGGASPAPPPPSSSSTLRPPPPISHDGASGVVNQGAINRLGAAGVSVPALGIGGGGWGSSAADATKANSPPPPPRGGDTAALSSHGTSGAQAQVSELQARFARLGTGGAGHTQASSGAHEVDSSAPGDVAYGRAAVLPQGKKKPAPPPPPPKKSDLACPGGPGPGVGEAPPPPVPMATRPAFQLTPKSE